MQNRSNSSQNANYFIVILLLAIGLRFAQLGVAPLNDFEAQAALGALDLSNGTAAQPAYVLLTRLLFQLFGSSEFLARLLPAIFGTSLVLLPLAWRSYLGEKPALLLSLLLAIDPGLVALSRLASGAILALAAALWAFTAWQSQRPVWTGILAAVALLAAPTIYVGVFAALLAWAILRPAIKLPRQHVRSAGIALAITLLLGGSLLLSSPQGFSGVTEVLVAFFVGQGPAPANLGTMFFALIGYGLPALVFGGIGAQRAWRSGEPGRRMLVAFAIWTLAVALVNPQRQVADLAWTLVPLWVLASLWMADFLRKPSEEPAAAYGEAILIGVLSIFFVLTVARLSAEGPMITANPGSFLPVIDTRAIFVVAIVGIAFLASILIALGWSANAATHGLVWSLALVSVLAMLSASTRFARGASETANDLWPPGPSVGQFQQLEETLADLSFWGAGQPQGISVEIVTQHPSVRWALRQYPSADSGETLPQVVVTDADTNTDDFAEYYGQSFGFVVQRTWDGWPPNFFSWLLFRQAPTQTQQVILWVQPGLLPGGELEVQNSALEVAP